MSSEEYKQEGINIILKPLKDKIEALENNQEHYNNLDKELTHWIGIIDGIKEDQEALHQAITNEAIVSLRTEDVLRDHFNYLKKDCIVNSSIYRHIKGLLKKLGSKAEKINYEQKYNTLKRKIFQAEKKEDVDPDMEQLIKDGHFFLDSEKKEIKRFIIHDEAYLNCPCGRQYTIKNAYKPDLVFIKDGKSVPKSEEVFCKTDKEFMEEKSSTDSKYIDYIKDFDVFELSLKKTWNKKEVIYLLKKQLSEFVEKMKAISLKTIIDHYGNNKIIVDLIQFKDLIKEYGDLI